MSNIEPPYLKTLSAGLTSAHNNLKHFVYYESKRLFKKLSPWIASF